MTKDERDDELVQLIAMKGEPWQLFMEDMRKQPDYRPGMDHLLHDAYICGMIVAHTLIRTKQL